MINGVLRTLTLFLNIFHWHWSQWYQCGLLHPNLYYLSRKLWLCILQRARFLCLVLTNDKKMISKSTDYYFSKPAFRATFALLSTNVIFYSKFCSNRKCFLREILNLTFPTRFTHSVGDLLEFIDRDDISVYLYYYSVYTEKRIRAVVSRFLGTYRKVLINSNKIVCSSRWSTSVLMKLITCVSRLKSNGIKEHVPSSTWTKVTEKEAFQ